MSIISIQKQRDIEACVKEAGEFQLREQLKLSTISIRDKSLNQLVSYVDVESEKMLVGGLRDVLPEAGFLTEEATTTQKNPELYWIIDPLDGTTNYLFGHEQYAISLGLQSHEKSLFGCIYIPATKEMFIANSEGAFLNGKAISVSMRHKLNETLIATGFPYYDFKELDAYLEILKVLMKETRGLRRMGSAAIDLAYTACGKFDAFFELNLSPWDVAAGALLIEKAGGISMDFNQGRDFIYGRTIISGNQLISGELQKLIRGFF